MKATSHQNALEPPPGAQIDPSRAREVLRAWIVVDGLQVSMIPAWDDPATWGIMLVDIARHAARMFADQSDVTFEEALGRIRQLWDAEMAHPTDMGSTKRGSPQ